MIQAVSLTFRNTFHLSFTVQLSKNPLTESMTESMSICYERLRKRSICWRVGEVFDRYKRDLRSRDEVIINIWLVTPNVLLQRGIFSIIERERSYLSNELLSHFGCAQNNSFYLSTLDSNERLINWCSQLYSLMNEWMLKSFPRYFIKWWICEIL